MTVLFIQKESKVNLLTLRAITNKDKVNSLIEKKAWKSTLISEEKTLYLYVDKESLNYNFFYLSEYFVNFVRNNKERNYNIDIKSFISPSLSEELVIQAISEGILFGSHSEISYKSK